MSEKLTTYMLREPDIPLPMDRDEFYRTQVKAVQKNGEATQAAEIVALLLFNVDGEIILQKRSSSKNHNPRMIDKAIGGHVKWGESPSYTMMVETVQELRVPSIVLRTSEDFKKTYKTLHNYLDNIAIIEELDRGIFQLDRKIDGVEYKLSNMVHLFIGVYTGSTKPVDKEASGILYYSLDALKEEMLEQPQLFTQDLHFYLENFKVEIQQFLSQLK